MSNKILSVTVETQTPTKLDDGEYIGYWFGYDIILKHNKRNYTLKTDLGVKCDVRVLVTVKDGIYTFNGI